jgi:hypothetical protein
MADQAQQLRSRDKIISELRSRQQGLAGAHHQHSLRIVRSHRAVEDLKLHKGTCWSTSEWPSQARDWGLASLEIPRVRLV